MISPPTDEQVAAYLRAIPKAELHLHLEGSLEPGFLLKLAHRNHLTLPFKDREDASRLYKYRSFRDFARLLLLGTGCLRTLEDFRDAVTHLGARLAGDNIRYAEVTWTPQFYLQRGIPLDEIARTMHETAQGIEARSGIVLRWIPDIVRSYPRPAPFVAGWAASETARECGVVALGLGGPESGHPASNFTRIFELARARGLPANPHAGEGEGPQSVRETIDSLRPRRIGHGVRAIEDPELVRQIAESRITLEVCITSNVRLGVYRSLAEHPVKQLIDAGCVVTLNSDDPALFRTSLSTEYVRATRACGLSVEDVERTILDSVTSSYLRDDEKSRMTAHFEKTFAQLRRELLGGYGQVIAR